MQPILSIPTTAYATITRLSNEVDGQLLAVEFGAIELSERRPIAEVERRKRQR